MKIACLFLSHRPPTKVFLGILRKILEHKNFSAFVHHDFSQSHFPEEIAQDLEIQLVKPSLTTKWGHVSKVPAIFKTIELAVETADADWYLTLSPNCYPIKPLNDLCAFLEATSYHTFIEFNELGPDKEGIYKWHWDNLFHKVLFRHPMLSRKGKFYYRNFKKSVNPQHTPFKDGYLPFTGSDWFALSRKAVDTMFAENLPNHPMIDHMARINAVPGVQVSPVEVVFQTHFAHQPNLNQAKHNLHYIDWENFQDWHPNVLELRHLDKLASSSAFFARKFQEGVSDQLLARIDGELLNQ